MTVVLYWSDREKKKGGPSGRDGEIMIVEGGGWRRKVGERRGKIGACALDGQHCLSHISPLLSPLSVPPSTRSLFLLLVANFLSLSLSPTRLASFFSSSSAFFSTLHFLFRQRPSGVNANFHVK